MGANFPYSISFDGATYQEKPVDTTPPSTNPPNAGRDIWRCLHKNESTGYDKTPYGMPEVRPSVDARPIDFTETMQKMHWEAMRLKNPTISSTQWRKVMDCERWATNYHGWDCKKTAEQRADFVNGRDLDKPLPQLMKAIIMGGSLYTGVADYQNNLLWMYPGIDGIDSNNLCTLNQALDYGWFFECISWERDRIVSMFFQGNGDRVYSLFFLREPSSYPLEWFQKWTDPNPPDPLKYYL